MKKISLFLKQILLWGLDFCIRFIRPLLGPTPSCRYTPPCSQYAKQAISKYGALKGTYLSVKRLLKCHPFHPGGYDPVP